MSQQPLNTIRIASPPDRAVLNFFDQLVKAFPPSHFNLTVGQENLGQFSNGAAFGEKFPLKDWEDTRIISSAVVHLHGGKVQLHFSRLITDFSNANLRTPSPWENEFWIFRNSNPAPAPGELIAVTRAVDAFREKCVGDVRTSTPASDNAREIVSRQLAELTALHTKIVRDADEARRAAAVEFDSRRSRLEEEWEARRKALDADTDVKRQSLQDEEARLVERQRELDDRGHMHARRELRADITSALKERLRRPGVSPQTSLWRGLFVSVNLLAIFGFAAAAWIGGFGFSQEVAPVNGEQPELQPWILAVYAIRISLPTAAAVGLLFYLLNWIRRIHADDVRAERELERYRYDIDRASWVVETILEAQSKEMGEVPQEWVHGVTHNMFARTETRDEDHSALEALGALLGMSAKAELGPTGPKLELRRDGLRRLGRAADGEP